MYFCLSAEHLPLNVLPTPAVHGAWTQAIGLFSMSSSRLDISPHPQRGSGHAVLLDFSRWCVHFLTSSSVFLGSTHHLQSIFTALVQVQMPGLSQSPLNWVLWGLFITNWHKFSFQHPAFHCRGLWGFHFCLGKRLQASACGPQSLHRYQCREQGVPA